ncbi:hypothetical protein WL21_04485 [Burkholderia ubonensis]|uniref:ATP-binding protein n=1 Tax=Burkholderia ubonensis TaxID=101571 RepID=UPI000756A3DB|nr:ATP-binding protein [Burkholderia ubonensis]KVO87648.1 hypothetical protein WJ81_15455 [Burkholderia ubonensis]KVZ57265.1 hypothetical protein WL20_23240 [Burkholderia ubonensis]KVZ72963.1 hypothetical protein WL21_04485 [Burkholderia ubonensis]
MRKLLDAAKALGSINALSIALLIALSSQPAGRVMSGVVDRALFDTMAGWYARDRPENIVVVDIDARTLAATLLRNQARDTARLLDRLGSASCVVFDMPLTPGLDYAPLKQAMHRHGRVVLVLPHFSKEASTLLPVLVWKQLAKDAAAVSHREVVIGHYGAVSGFVPYAQTVGGRLSHVALSALQVAGIGADDSISPYIHPSRYPLGQGRDGTVLALLHRPDDLAHYSYVDVLEGRVPDTAFAGKIVFIGHSTWLGEGTYRLSALDHTEIPRAHLDALLTDAVARRHLVRELSVPLEMAVYAALAVGIVLICRLIHGRMMHVAALGWVVALLALPLALLTFGIWLPVGTLPLVGLLIYGFFAWERHATVLALLRREITDLRTIASSIGTTPALEAPPLVADGALHDVQSAMRQIRSWQKIYVDMINQLPYPVFFALDGKVAIWNAKAADYLGDAASHEGSPDARVEPIEQAVAESIRTGAEVSRDTTWNGSSYVLLCEPLSGDADAGAGSQADDTPQCSHLICLLDLNDAGEVAARDKRVLRHIAHDLRSPLTSILALIEHRHEQQAERGGTDDRAFLSDLRRQADYSLRIADGFVQLSRAERLSRDRFEPLMLADLAIEAIGQTFVAARRKSIALRGPDGDIDGSLVDGDPHMLMRALVNVIGNAIKYSPAHTAIDIRIERTDDARLALHVMDQGIGMTDETIDRLFEPFFQAKRNASEESGVGLGLPFVQAVVERHGGTIDVISKPEHGTDFVILLPARVHTAIN